MEPEDTVHSRPLALIVRVWVDEEAVALRGDVEHVYTGERRLFQAYDALVALIEQWRQDAYQDADVYQR